MLGLLSDAEKDEIVRAGIERFFGRTWRSKLKLRRIPPEQKEYLGAGPGNEFALIHQLMAISRARSDRTLLTQAAKLGIQYAYHLEHADRWHDLAAVGGALLQLVERDRNPEEWTALAALYGAGLRMSDKKEESLTYLRAALEAGEGHFTNEEKADIWLEIALADKHDDEEAAAAAAREVQKYSKEDSSKNLQAGALIAKATLRGKTLTDELLELERRARAKGQVGVANSIALTLYEIEAKPKEELRHVQRVLDSEKPSYTRARALVNKAEILRKLDDRPDLSQSELAELTSAYTYLHGQRFGNLLDRCHAVLWEIFESKGDSQRLLRLFRHSSFLWRIRGRDDKETNYLERLKDAKLQERPLGKTVVVEFSYFLRRLKIIFHVG